MSTSAPRQSDGRALNVDDPRSLLLQYLDGALPDAETSRVESALCEDPALRRLLVEMAVDGSLVKEAFEAQTDKIAAKEGSPQQVLSSEAIRAAAAARREKAAERPHLTPRQRKRRAVLRYGILPLAAAAAFLAIVHTYNLHQIKQVKYALCAEIIDIRGDVSLDAAPATAGGEVQPGQEVRTGPDGRVTLRYDDKTTIEIGEESDLTLLISESRRNRSKRLYLDRGELSADVAKQRANAPMRIATPHAEVEVIGTRFTLAVDAEARTTRLEVTEGRVRLTRAADTASVVIAGGQYIETGESAEGSFKSLAMADLAGAEAIFVDEFDGEALNPFWTQVRPPDQVTVKDGKLFLWVEEAAGTAEVVSKPMELGPAPIMITVRRATPGFYGPSPPQGKGMDREGKPRHRSGLEILDASGEVLCRIERVKTKAYASLRPQGPEPEEILLGDSAILGNLAIVLDSSGRIGVFSRWTRKARFRDQLIKGPAATPVGSVRIRLYADFTGRRHPKIPVERVEIHRLTEWPKVKMRRTR